MNLFYLLIIGVNAIFISAIVIIKYLQKKEENKTKVKK